MRNTRCFRLARILTCGACLLQFGACEFESINNVIQTVLLGVTAAGSIAILQNI